jgi:hypothetical protein
MMFVRSWVGRFRNLTFTCIPPPIAKLLHWSCQPFPIVLLTCPAISRSRSGDPCENVALNKRGVFNRKTESSGGMLAGL